MLKIGLLSDTHAWWDDKYMEYFSECDEIWHAGDIGSDTLAARLAALKPALTSCPRIYIQTIQTSVESDFQDMRMSGNEKIRAGVVQFFPDKRVITSGIASYMCHHHVYFFNFEMSDLRILQPKRLPVDVAIYGTKRFQGSQACRQCVRTDISSKTR